MATSRRSNDRTVRRRAPAVTGTQALRTRRALREALLALLQQKPLERITVRDLAAQAEVGYATFFRHYRSTAQLLDEIAAEQITRLVEFTIPVLSARDTRKACLALCQYVDQQRTLWTALLTGGASGTLREEFIRLSIQKGPTKLPRRSWLPVELGAHFGVAATIEIISWWLKRPDELSPSQVATILDRLVVTPAVSPRR